MRGDGWSVAWQATSVAPRRRAAGPGTCVAPMLCRCSPIVSVTAVSLGPRQARGVHLSGARKGELSDVESRARTGGDAGLSEASAGSVPCALALGPADYVNTTGDVGLPIEHGHEEASG